MNGPSSERLIEALWRPALLGDPADEVTLLQTHISWVLTKTHNPSRERKATLRDLESARRLD